jgi:hypothetical protein
MSYEYNADILQLYLDNNPAYDIITADQLREIMKEIWKFGKLD